MFWKNTLIYNCTVLLIYLLCILGDRVNSKAISDSNENNESETLTLSTPTVIFVCCSGIFFLLAVGISLFKCTDCYNSEVSSEFHPASGGGGGGSSVKWGGSVGYSSNNMTSGTVTFGETVNLDQHQSLPYSMIPTTIPESGGFQGYHTAGGRGDNSAAPMMGYQSQTSMQASAPAENHRGGSRHYNPAVEQQQPPPAYTEALRQSSLRGNSGR